MERTWSAVRFDALATRHWDGEDEIVVHDPARGQTHRVTELGWALIRTLAAWPRTVEQLALQFSSWFEPTDTMAGIERHLQATLTHLLHAGLVAHSATRPS